MTFAEQLAWLVTMARTPGWKAHAWHRAQELEACSSGLWAGIKERLTAAMKGQGNADPRA